MLFKRVVIIGTGLIGGSLALALKRKKLAREIIGIARHKETLRMAKKIGAVDFATTDINTVKNADLIIFATPVEMILSLAKKISRIAKKECIIFDVGSTKEKIVANLQKLFPNYIGTHPLAGSQKYGIRYARADLFLHSLCILTPTANTTKEIQRKVKSLWECLGAKIVIISAKQHDKIIAFVSHLPHAIAFTLMELIPGEYLDFAASGLKDTTRIAASHPGLWRDIFLTNRKAILKTLREFEKSLLRFKRLLISQDERGLYRFLLKAKTKREGLG